jgi:hypothetical protein
MEQRFIRILKPRSDSPGALDIYEGTQAADHLPITKRSNLYSFAAKPISSSHSLCAFISLRLFCGCRTVR